MKLHLDEASDVLYLRLDDSAILKSDELAPGVVLDFDAAERVVSIELRGVGRSLPGANLRRLEVEVG